MGMIRFSTTPAVMAAASFLLAYLNSANAVSQRRYLRQLATDDYTLLGCFKDSKKDRLLGHKTFDDEMTTEMCFTYCHEMGAPLMATQWGVECWCATEVEVDHERHGEGAECDYPCAGNEDEMCGGYDALMLYLIESDDAPSHVNDDDYPDSEDSPVPAPAPTPEPQPEPESTPAPTSTTPSTELDGAFSPDIVKIIDVVGDNPGGLGWADSYSVGSRCYMHTTFDHHIGDFEVSTPRGTMTIKELYGRMGGGPGYDGHPLYNDIQCGNGPANTAPDEVRCPGLVEFGRDGCGQIGPFWDLSEME